MAEVHSGQLYVVQDEGDEAAHSSDADLVAALQNSCWPSRTVMKNKTQDANSADTKEQENSTYKVQCLHAAVPLQSGSNCLRSVVADSVVELQMSALAHGDEKHDANSTDEKLQENSSYKAQGPHAAVLMQSGSNRARSLVADMVAALENSGRPSRTETKNKTQIIADEKLQENSSYKGQLLNAAVLQQSGSNRGRSFGADFVAVLQNSCRPSRTETKNKTQIQQIQKSKKIHLTRSSSCTLLF